MEIKTSEQQIIPYSHHYRCFPQMVGSAVNQSVFMYLLDEYMYRLKTGVQTDFPVTANEISIKRNIDRRTVSKCLADLQIMKLITLDGKMCTIHHNRFISLIRAFDGLTKTVDKKKFIASLESGDYTSLEELGYEMQSNGEEVLLSMKGADSDMYKNAQQCAKMYMDEHFCTPVYKNVHDYAKMHNSVQKCTYILDEIRQEITSKYSKEDFFNEISGDFLDFLSEEELENMLEVIFEGKEAENFIFRLEFPILLHYLVCAKMYIGVCKNVHDYVQKCTTVNKEIKENKIHHEDFFELDLKGLENSLSGYRQAKVKNSLPFFPVHEVEEYIADIRNCLDRADKIYINQVWEIAHECFDQEAELDENGKELIPANSNIESVGVMKERLMKDILFPAFDRTQEIIEQGSITVNGEDFQVTAVIDRPDDFANIIDWELKTLLDGENYIISTRRVRNIYGEPVEQGTSRSVRRDKREDDMSYLQKIIQIGDDDEAYTKLTPIELVIYNFLNEYFQIVGNGEVGEPKRAFINRTSLAMFYVDAKDKGISETDFLSVLSKDKPDSTGSLNLRQRMFSADKIRKWNGLHSVESIVDSFEVKG